MVLRGVQRGIDTGHWTVTEKRSYKSKECYDKNEPERVPLYFYHQTDFTESIIENTKGVFGSIDLEHLDI